MLRKRQRVFAGTSDFVPDGSFKPAVSPRPVYLLKRGDINKPGELAPPLLEPCGRVGALQDFLENDRRRADQVIALEEPFERGDLGCQSTAQEVDPDGRIDKDHQATRRFAGVVSRRLGTS